MMRFCILIISAFMMIDTRVIHCFTMTMSGKGFGNVAKKIDSSILKASRPQEHRTVHGSFAKLLSKTSVIFEDLKNKHGCSRDIYARLSNSNIFWFVGKVNHKETFTPVDAVIFYAPLITEYAKALRPLDLAGKGKAMTDLQLWTARGNSEMDIVQNIGHLERIEFSMGEDTSLGIVSDDVGFEPEIYMNGEMGFRVKRDANGAPIDEPFEVTMGTSDDLKKAGI